MLYRHVRKIVDRGVKVSLSEGLVNLQDEVSAPTTGLTGVLTACAPSHHRDPYADLIKFAPSSFIRRLVDASSSRCAVETVNTADFGSDSKTRDDRSRNLKL